MAGKALMSESEERRRDPRVRLDGRLGGRPTDMADFVDGMWADYLQDFRAGVGFGLQYLTPLGPMRLDLAWNPDPRASENEAVFTWHFSVGMAF